MNLSTDKIYIDGEALDFEGEYSITFEANDFLNWKPGTAYKSERLTFYNTPKNRRLLANVFHSGSNTDGEFDAVYVSKVVTMSGRLKVLQAGRSKCEAVFYSGNGQLWDELKGLRLNDVDCSQYDHTLNLTNVSNSETYSASNFYMYDFCDRGAVIDTGFIYLIERFPAINLRLLLDEIFNGYTVSGDLIDEAWFKRLFLMFTQSNQIRNSDEWLTSALVSVSENVGSISCTVTSGDPKTFIKVETVLAMTESGTGLFDNGGNFGSNKYTVPETGTYRFIAVMYGTMTFDAFATDIAGSVYFRLKKNTTALVTYTWTLTNDKTQNSGTQTLDTGFIELTAGDEITITYQVSGTATVINTATLEIGTGTLTNQVSRWYGSGSTVQMSAILPDIDVLEFLNDLFIYFGLYPLYDVEGRKVYLYQLKTDTTVNDLTDRVNYFDIEFELPEKMNYRLQFADDKTDKYLEYALANKVITDGKYEQDNGAKDWIEKKMRHLTPTATAWNYNSSTGVTLKQPRMWADVNGAKFSTKFGLRILYYTGYTDYSYELKHGVESNVSQTQFDGVPSFDMLDGSVNLNFGDVDGVTGMWQYNRRIFDMLTSGKVATVEVLLTNSEIANLYACTTPDLRTPVWINNAYFNGRFLILKARQTKGNFFELTLLQKFD